MSGEGLARRRQHDVDRRPLFGSLGVPVVVAAFLQTMGLHVAGGFHYFDGVARIAAIDLIRGQVGVGQSLNS